jgi:hypothetical protein
MESFAWFDFGYKVKTTRHADEFAGLSGLVAVLDEVATLRTYEERVGA